MLISLISVFTLGSFLFANENVIYCDLKHEDNQPELRIKANDVEPLELALRWPQESEFTVKDMSIKNVIGTFQTDQHYFIAKPNITADMIDWSQTSSCFVEIETQWYFNFNYRTGLYFVQLSPNYIKKDEMCVTPRLPLQTKELNCSF